MKVSQTYQWCFGVLHSLEPSQTVKLFLASAQNWKSPFMELINISGVKIEHWWYELRKSISHFSSGLRKFLKWFKRDRCMKLSWSDFWQSHITSNWKSFFELWKELNVLIYQWNTPAENKVFEIQEGIVKAVYRINLLNSPPIFWAIISVIVQNIQFSG